MNFKIQSFCFLYWFLMNKILVFFYRYVYFKWVKYKFQQLIKIIKFNFYFKITIYVYTYVLNSTTFIKQPSQIRFLTKLLFQLRDHKYSILLIFPRSWLRLCITTWACCPINILGIRSGKRVPVRPPQSSGSASPHHFLRKSPPFGPYKGCPLLYKRKYTLSRFKRFWRFMLQRYFRKTDCICSLKTDFLSNSYLSKIFLKTCTLPN